MLKIEDLKVGDELVCINRDGFNGSHEDNRNISDFTVHSIQTGGVIFVQNGRYYIPSDELKYFKKKGQLQYMFDDLIDVVSQGFKDGVLSEMSFDKKSFTIVESMGIHHYYIKDDGILHSHKGHQNNESFETIISFTKSLYKDRFTIEAEDDIARIKVGAKVTLLNESSGVVNFIGNINRSLCLSTDKCNTELDIFSLKGAAVEQSKC